MGMALTMIAGAVLIGRVIRNFPYLLPNRLPGLVVHELGPSLALALALALGAAFAITRSSSMRAPARACLLIVAAAAVGTASLAYEFAHVLAPRWW